MCTRQSRKVIWDMINTLFLTLQLSNLLLLLSFSTRKHTSMASRVILSNFFEKQLIQNHPQYLTGLSRALFPTTFLEIAVYRSITHEEAINYLSYHKGKIKLIPELVLTSSKFILVSRLLFAIAWIIWAAILISYTRMEEGSLLTD